MPVFGLHSAMILSIVSGNPDFYKLCQLSLILISSQLIISRANDTGVAGVKAF